MKQKQFTEEQIVAILHEAEKGDKSIGAICREHGIAEVTFYRWRNRFGGLRTRDVQRLRELEKENARLIVDALARRKRLLAERDLELDVVKEALSKDW